jgi:hypothetical protein
MSDLKKVVDYRNLEIRGKKDLGKVPNNNKN